MNIKPLVKDGRAWSRNNLHDFLEKNYPLFHKQAESKGFTGGRLAFLYDNKEVPNRQYKFIHQTEPISRGRYADGSKPIAIASGHSLSSVLADFLETLEVDATPLVGIVVNKRFNTTFGKPSERRNMAKD